MDSSQNELQQVKEARNKKRYSLLLHLREVLKLVILSSGDNNQNSGYSWWWWGEWWLENMGNLGDRGVLYLDCGGS